MSSKSLIANNWFEGLKEQSNEISRRFDNKVEYKNLCNPRKVLKLISTLKSAKLSELGSGVYGIVYKGPIGKDKFIVIKSAKRAEDNLRYEYQMMYFLRKRSTFFAPAPYKFAKCDRQIMYYEYANGGDLRTYMNKIFKDSETLKIDKTSSIPLRTVAPIYFKAIVTHVLYTLSNIQRKVPHFRHHDLHLNNILISKAGKLDGYSKYIFKSMGDFAILKKNLGIQVYLHDFSFSTCEEFPNPEIESGVHIKGYGIGVKSHPFYDAHYFLNCMYIEYGSYPEFAETKRFILSILPREYLGSTSRYIENYRLRYNVKHNLPLKIENIFKNNYFIKPNRHHLEDTMKSILFSVAAKGQVSPEEIVKTIKSLSGPAKKTTYAMNKSNELKIGTRKCRLYKKPELMALAKTSDKKLTKAALCELLKKKYINKV